MIRSTANCQRGYLVGGGRIIGPVVTTATRPANNHFQIVCVASRFDGYVFAIPNLTNILVVQIENEVKIDVGHNRVTDAAAIDGDTTRGRLFLSRSPQLATDRDRFRIIFVASNSQRSDLVGRGRVICPVQSGLRRAPDKQLQVVAVALSSNGNGLAD